VREIVRARQTIKFLGSLKLAVALLSVAAAVMVWATFYEARTSTAAATALVYRSWWFNALLGALGVNLTAAAALRWPWSRHQIGFVVTHAGLILILGGCSAAFHFGTEGLMDLYVGRPPSDAVRCQEQALAATWPKTGKSLKETLRVGRDGVSPTMVTLTDGAWLAVDEHLPNAAVELMEVRDGGETRNPTVELALGRAATQRDISQWLVADDPDLNRAMWGPALMEFCTARNETEANVLTATSSVQGLVMRVVVLPDNSLRYVSSSRDGIKNGTLTVGEPMQPGWMDVRITATRLATNAVTTEQVTPLRFNASQNRPAMRVTVHDNGTPRSEWLRLGRPVTVNIGGQPVRLAFTDSMTLPFAVALEDFVVEYNEGTQMPGGWTSKLLFTDAASGKQARAEVWMNHPARFGGYKFSQASWNPQNLKYTVLQVKRDPTWVIVLTWSGSALTIIGIGLMFYARQWV
jgi:hypothetical protein